MSLKALLIFGLIIMNCFVGLMQSQGQAKSKNTIIPNEMVEILFQHPDLINPNKVTYSTNNKYVVVSKDDLAYQTIVYAVYNLENPALLSSRKVEMPIGDIGIVGVSNDARYLELFNYKLQKAFALYDTQTDSLIFAQSEETLFIYSFDREINHFNTGIYEIRTSREYLRILNTQSKKEFTLVNDFDKNTYKWQSVELSPDGKYLGAFDNKVIKVWNIKTKELVWTSPKQQSFFYEPGFKLLKNNVIVCNKVNGDQKGMHLYWYDFVQDKVFYSSNHQPFLSVVYLAQYDNVLCIANGGSKNKKVSMLTQIDLATGLSKQPNRTLYNNTKFFKFHKDVFDSLVSENPQKYEYTNDNHQYAENWGAYYSKFYKDNGTPKDGRKKCQLSADFFLEKGINEFYLNANYDSGLVRNYTIYFALDNKATYINSSGDMSFFAIIKMKKQLLFWNGNNASVEDRDVLMLTTEQGKPFFYSNDLFYFSTANLSNIVHFKSNNKVYSFEQFDIKYNRPDIILNRLGYADSSLIAAYHKAYLKRLKKMNFTEDMLKDDFHLPEIKIEDFEEIPTITDSSSVGLNLQLKDSKYKLDRINVWVNNVAVYGSNGLSLRDKNVQNYNTNLQVNLVKGNNKVQVSVLNQAGAESYKETFEIECKAGKSKSNLYLIAIGESKFIDSNYNLTYAAKDAQDVAALFAKSKIYEKVITKTLTNEQVTKENIEALRSFLDQAEINDEVMIFIAGHGVLDEELDYFFASYDMDFNNPSQRGIAYEDLEGLLDGIKPLKKVLLIDACHSGEIDKDEVELLAVNEDIGTEGIQFRAVGNSVKPKLGMQNTSELTKALFTDLRKGTGATVISSAGGGEYAMESGEWKNGLFTYCLLKGIETGEADLNKDGEIWLKELQQYVQTQVTELSGGKQQPTSRIENSVLDYRVW